MSAAVSGELRRRHSPVSLIAATISRVREMARRLNDAGYDCTLAMFDPRRGR